MDFELEMAFITTGANKLGKTIPINETEQYIFGMVLLNDWSARDIQAWEYAPLGPFLGKSFATSISPWIVTMDALQPFKVEGPEQDPKPLPYLRQTGKNNYDIHLSASIKPKGKQEAVVTETNLKYMYWSIYQQLAHQASNGCNICTADIYGSGTISGPEKGSFGSMLEITWNGKEPIKMKDGTDRKFLKNGDTVILRGYCKNDKVRIGFGECRGLIKKTKEGI
jgi:fumarylacetoacetase